MPCETASQSAWVTPPGLSITILTNWLRPEPLSSTSTISRPPGTTRSASWPIFEIASLRFIGTKTEGNKKVGFRPLHVSVRQCQYNRMKIPATGVPEDAGCPALFRFSEVRFVAQFRGGGGRGVWFVAQFRPV